MIPCVFPLVSRLIIYLTDRFRDIPPSNGIGYTGSIHPHAAQPIFDTLLHFPRGTSSAGASSSPSCTTGTPNSNGSNERDGEEEWITELTTSNIAIHCPSTEHDAQWITPRLNPTDSNESLSSSDNTPFLRGVMRAHLLSLLKIRETDISVKEFRRLVREEGRSVVGINGLR